MSKNVALVLSSGGAKGLAQIGAIEELESQGFNITSISGSSIGSVIGGLYAMDRLHEYSQWVKTLNKRAIWGLMDFTFTTNGLLKGEKVFDKMKTFIPDMDIEDMRIPFTAVATDILHEKEIVFDRGSFYAAARASVAIPAMITPVEYKDTFLVDGGILNPVPIEHVVRGDDDILVVVNLYGDKTPKPEKKAASDKKQNNGYFSGLSNAFSNLIATGDKESPGYISLLTTSSAAMVHKLAKMNIEKFRPDIVVNIPSDSANTFDFHRSGEMIKVGAEAMRAEILKFRSRV